jgi:hypothetical protein
MPKRVVWVQDEQAVQPVRVEQNDDSYEFKLGSMYLDKIWTTVYLT